MKILYSWGHHGLAKKRATHIIESRRQAGFEITAVDHRGALVEDQTYSPRDLEQRWQEGYKPLHALYNRVRRLAADHDVLVVEYDNVYLPRFLESLDIFKVYFCGDDPEGSEVRSKPYVRYFDFCFAQTLGYDAEALVWEKYLEWGASRAAFSPFGVCDLDYDPGFSETQIHRGERSLPVVFVGSAGFRAQRVKELKRRLPLSAYGIGWGRFSYLPLIHPMRVLGKITRRPHDPYLPDDRLVATYLSAKIGINTHLSYGVGNRRMYALPANGVLQVCDQPALASRLFEPDREIICFDTLDEAVEKIEYYLAHDDERKEVAAAGYRRVIKDYKDEIIFRRAMAKVKEAMSTSTKN